MRPEIHGGSTRRRQRSAGPDGKRSGGPDGQRSAGSGEMRCRTRGNGAGSQIQRAGSTSSKSAYSESFEAFAVPTLAPSLEPSLAPPTDCPAEDCAPAPLFFGRTLAGKIG